MEHTTKQMCAVLRAAQTRREFADWLRADAERLTSAAQLLGGEPWKRRAVRVSRAMAEGADPEEVVADLRALHRLLTLEYTNDLDSPEAARFFDLHPDDPRADEARICAEALERGLNALAVVRAVAIGKAA